jgi:hypothetical protein
MMKRTSSEELKDPKILKNDKQLGMYQCTFCIMDQQLNLCQQARNNKN